MNNRSNIPCGHSSCPHHNSKSDMHCDKTYNGMPFALACDDYTEDPFENMVSIQDGTKGSPRTEEDYARDMAGRAYNQICCMIGGRWPAYKLEEEAPEAHRFFMMMMGVEVKGA